MRANNYSTSTLIEVLFNDMNNIPGQKNFEQEFTNQFSDLPAEVRIPMFETLKYDYKKDTMELLGILLDLLNVLKKACEGKSILEIIDPLANETFELGMQLYEAKDDTSLNITNPLRMFIRGEIEGYSEGGLGAIYKILDNARNAVITCENTVGIIQSTIPVGITTPKKASTIKETFNNVKPKTIKILKDNKINPLNLDDVISTITDMLFNDEPTQHGDIRDANREQNISIANDIATVTLKNLATKDIKFKRLPTKKTKKELVRAIDTIEKADDGDDDDYATVVKGKLLMLSSIIA